MISEVTLTRTHLGEEDREGESRGIATVGDEILCHLGQAVEDDVDETGAEMTVLVVDVDVEGILTTTTDLVADDQVVCRSTSTST